MPGCDRYVLLMSEKLDRPLREREEQELSRHLEICLRCRSTWADFSTLSDVLRLTPEEEPPESLKNDILAAVNALPAAEPGKAAAVEKPHASRPAWRKWVAAAAAMAIVLAGTLTAWKTGWLPGGSFGQPAAPTEELPEENEAEALMQSGMAVVVEPEDAPNEAKTQMGAAADRDALPPAMEELHHPDESAVTAMLLCYHIGSLPEQPEYLIPEEAGSWLCPAEDLSEFQALLQTYDVVTAWEAKSGYTGVAGEFVRITLVP